MIMRSSGQPRRLFGSVQPGQALLRVREFRQAHIGVFPQVKEDAVLLDRLVLEALLLITTPIP